MSRPDYIKCIKHSHADLEKTSWCGKPLSPFDWVFQSIDHAVYSIQNEDRLIPCPKCLEKITIILKNSND